MFGLLDEPWKQAAPNVKVACWSLSGHWWYNWMLPKMFSSRMVKLRLKVNYVELWCRALMLWSSKWIMPRNWNLQVNSAQSSNCNKRVSSLFGICSRNSCALRTCSLFLHRPAEQILRNAVSNVDKFKLTSKNLKQAPLVSPYVSVWLVADPPKLVGCGFEPGLP